MTSLKKNNRRVICKFWNGWNFSSIKTRDVSGLQIFIPSIFSKPFAYGLQPPSKKKHGTCNLKLDPFPFLFGWLASLLKSLVRAVLNLQIFLHRKIQTHFSPPWEKQKIPEGIPPKYVPQANSSSEFIRKTVILHVLLVSASFEFQKSMLHCCFILFLSIFPWYLTWLNFKKIAAYSYICYSVDPVPHRQKLPFLARTAPGWICHVPYAASMKHGTWAPADKKERRSMKSMALDIQANTETEVVNGVWSVWFCWGPGEYPNLSFRGPGCLGWGWMDFVTTKWGATLPETNNSPLKVLVSNGILLFQGSILSGYISFRECISLLSWRGSRKINPRLIFTSLKWYQFEK